MKSVHLRLELARDSKLPNGVRTPSSFLRAVGWNLAGRAAELALAPGSVIDVAYRIRENFDPDYGGIEAEILGMMPCCQ